MTTGIRKKYSKEFKLDAVSLVIDHNLIHKYLVSYEKNLEISL